MPGIIDYDRQMQDRYHNPTLADKIRNYTVRFWFNVTRPVRSRLRQRDIERRRRKEVLVSDTYKAE